MRSRSSVELYFFRKSAQFLVTDFLLLKKCFCQQAQTKNDFCAKSNIYKVLPLALNCHFSGVDLDQLVADAVQAAPKNRVYRAYWQAQKSQNLAGWVGHGFWGGSETRALRSIISTRLQFWLAVCIACSPMPCSVGLSFLNLLVSLPHQTIRLQWNVIIKRP